MKKLFFTIVFVSVISLFGISKASALPVGSIYENWDANKRQAGQFYASNGSLVPFYAYDGSGSMSCPYLDVQNELSPLACYFDSYYRSPGMGSSFLTNSYACAQGDCISTAQVVNLVLFLYDGGYNQIKFVPGEQYHISVDMGVTSDYITILYDFLSSAVNVQQGDGVVSNLASNCYYADNPANIFKRNYCNISFDYVPASSHNLVFFDFTKGLPLADLTSNIEWLLYPLITQDLTMNSDKYTMKSNQYAFISGLKSGRVYLEEKYFLSFDSSYLNYFDINRDTQPYSSYINDFNFTEYGDFMYYDYNLSNFSGAELVMLSTNAWTDYPYSKIEFYVPKGAYVDIVSFNPVGNAGNTLTFNYKNPDTGAMSNVSVNSFSFNSQSSTLFANITNGLSLFKDSILNVGTIFSEFYNNVDASLGWFYVVIFSTGVLAIMLALFL